MAVFQGKPVLTRKAKTIIDLNNQSFKHKLLCDGKVVNTGDACVYKCSFCYVPSMMQKLVYQMINEYNQEHGTQHKFPDFVIRREEPLRTLGNQLRQKRNKVQSVNDPSDQSVVYSSTTVDPAANMELLNETAQWVNYLLDNTFWQIRLLSKSSLLPHLIKKGLVPNKRRPGSNYSHHDRIIFGFSTGSIQDEVAKSIEAGTSFVSQRIKALHWLQDEGFRTYGMICPSLPQEDYTSFSKKMVELLRPERMEHIWAEVINLRGESFKRTYNSLLSAGLAQEADRLASVTRGETAKTNWEAYARSTFNAHTKHFKPSKLRFLQYVDRNSLEWWKNQTNKGAILLGRLAEDRGLVSDEKSAPDRYYC